MDGYVTGTLMGPDIVSRLSLAALEHRFYVITLYNVTFAE